MKVNNRALNSVVLLVSVVLCAGNSQKNVQHNEEVESNVNLKQHMDSAISETQLGSPFIGFTVWAQKQLYYTEGDTIIFDGIMLNEGSHYNPVTGRFTCPKTGVYFISVSFKRTDDSGDTRIRIMKNGQIVLSTSDWNNFPVSNTVSNSALVSCAKDEDIYLYGWFIGSVHGAPDVPYSTFTVFLVHPQKVNPEAFEGFSSWKNEGQEYNNGDVITFSGINYNDGDYFDPQLNRFHCPVTGVYYVTVNYYQGTKFPQYLGVTQNEQTVLSSSHDKAEWNTFSNSRLLRCRENDTLMVTGAGEGYVSGYPTYPYTTFSAMLIKDKGPLVGFSVFKKNIQTYVAEDTIKFEGILLDEGGYYNRLLNRFQCPVNGIYYFALNLKKLGTRNIHVDLVRNTGDVIFRLEETLGHHAEGNTISNSAIVRCSKGESVLAKATDSGTVYGTDNAPETTFTGYLLRRQPE